MTIISHKEKLIYGSLFYAITHRLPWLGVSILGGIVGSIIMVYFSMHFSFSVSLPLILSFVPLLMGLGGNIGNQSATIVVRAIATDPNFMDDKNKVIIKELTLGFIIGGLIGLLVAIYIFMTTNDVLLATSISITVLITMASAAIMGAMLPISLKTFKIDPAVASAPFISTVLDIVTQIIYFIIIMVIFTLF